MLLQTGWILWFCWINFMVLLDEFYGFIAREVSVYISVTLQHECELLVLLRRKIINKKHWWKLNTNPNILRWLCHKYQEARGEEFAWCLVLGWVTVFPPLRSIHTCNILECIPVGCVPPAAVAVPGGLHQAPPGSRPLWDQTPPPGTRHPPGAETPPWEQTHHPLLTEWQMPVKI